MDVMYDSATVAGMVVQGYTYKVWYGGVGTLYTGLPNSILHLAWF